MERRKLLVGLGALGAGGIGAFGTEAFTSVEANRNVDVAVAGDASAYLAVQPTGSANANDYVQTESDGTVSIELDGDGGASGAGVNQDAVTEIDELLSLVNQGTQEVAVYVDEDSPAVTFRADGSSIEGPSSAVSLGVGESVTVGITVDTLNNDVDGSLLDAVTLVATADNPSAIDAPAPSSFDALVNQDGSADYDSIQAAVDGESAGATIGLEADVTVSQSVVQIDKEGITLASASGRKTVRNEGLSGNADGSVLQVTASDVTIQSLEVVTAASVTSNNQAPIEIDVTSGGSGATVLDNVVRRPDGNGDTAVKGTPEISVRKGVSDVTVRGNMLDGGAISFNEATGSVVGNTVQNVQTEGIFAFSYSDAPTLTVRNNIVDNHDTAAEDKRELKVTTQPASLNDETDPDAQFDSLLAENEVNTVRIAGSDGVVADADGSDNRYADLGTAVREAGTDGFVRVLGGTYDGPTVSTGGVTVSSADGVRPTVEPLDPNSSGRIVDVRADGVTVEGLEVVGEGTSVDTLDVGVAGPGSGLTVENVLVRNVLTGVQFNSGSSDCTARFVTVENAQVGVSPQGDAGHLVERSDFTGLITGDYDPSPEGLGVSANRVESRNNNYGEDVALRVYEGQNASIEVLSDGDFFGTSGEDGEVVANDGNPIDEASVTVQDVVTTANDAGVR